MDALSDTKLVFATDLPQVLSNEQKKLIANMRDDVRKYSQHDYQLDDYYLGRWLVARDWNVSAASDLYIQSMKWRREFSVDELYKTLPKDESTATLFDAYSKYWPGDLRDSKDGWLVMFTAMGRVVPKSVIANLDEEFRFKFNVWRMEKVEEIRRQRQHSNGWNVGVIAVTDLAGLGWAHMGSSAMKVFKSLTAVNRLNYPETLRKSYIINAPAIFTMMWKLISPFLDPSTIDKTSVLGSNFLSELEKVMEKSQIPSDLGGTGLPLPRGGVFEWKDESPTSYHGFCKTANEQVISRSSCFEFDVKNAKATQIIEVEFVIEDLDVDFWVYRKDENDGGKIIVLEKNRITSKKVEIVKKSVTITNDGWHCIVWDNSFSWTRSKTIFFKGKRCDMSKCMTYSLLSTRFLILLALPKHTNHLLPQTNVERDEDLETDATEAIKQIKRLRYYDYFQEN